MNARTGSGNIVSEIRNAGSFKEVHASGAVNVHLKKGPQTSVTVEADDNIIKYVETNVRDNSLNIRIRQLTSLRNVTINIYVTAPDLHTIIGSAGAEIDSKDEVSSFDRITVKASSASEITLNLDAPVIDLEASSAAKINVSGRTRDLKAEGSSAAGIHAFGLQAENVDASASSSADIDVFASIKLKGHASSAGSVNYKGGAPKVEKEESSSGSVEPEG